MNKKRLLAVIVIGVFVLTFVNAGLIVYYGQVTADIEVTQPITITGNLGYTMGNVMAGDTVEGEGSVSISNNADFPIDVVISNDAPDGITVIYRYSTCYNEVEGCSVYQILEGNTITIPKKAEGWGSGVLLRISYELDSMLETGTYTITTIIDDVE